MTQYKTISSDANGQFNDKGSRFLAFARHILSENEALTFIEEVRKEHHKARHVCYAYRIGTIQPVERVNDDGEPAHTAGQPILNQIRKYGLNYIVIAVVRYFGGVLLGKGGLIQAYGSAAADAILSAQIVTKTELQTAEISFHMSRYNEVIQLVKKNKLTILSEVYDQENCKIKYEAEAEFMDEYAVQFKTLIK
jgi:uncharacterized YigZ family protein